MYLRNVKQILRAGSFDERRYAFGGLIDLLRACQRDGLVRMERDRRGGLRVFQGPALARPAAPPRVESESRPLDVETDGDMMDGDDQRAFIEPLEPVRPIEVIDAEESDVIDTQPVSVVDTTAELLGRAKPRKPRARATGSGNTAAPSSSSGRGSRKTAGTRKTAGGAKRSRSKKTADE